MFGADWCKYCNEAKPVYVKLAKENPELSFGYIDVDTLATKVKGIPRFIVLNKGKRVDKLNGYNKTKLKNLVKGLIAFE